MIVDSVYEGKSMAGLIDLCQKNQLKGSNILYVHLGGSPALNAYYQAFEDLSNIKKMAKAARY